jgi:hypothetical protein
MKSKIQFQNAVAENLWGGKSEIVMTENTDRCHTAIISRRIQSPAGLGSCELGSEKEIIIVQEYHKFTRDKNGKSIQKIEINEVFLDENEIEAIKQLIGYTL